MFTHMIAVSESTPGPIMANTATYVGSGQAGLPGAAIATIGVVLPSFIIILLIVTLMKNLIKNKYVQAVLRGIKPCFIGIVLAMGIYMVIGGLVPNFGQAAINWRGALMTGVLFAITIGHQKAKKKDFPPILLIVLSAGMGIVTFAV